MQIGGLDANQIVNDLMALERIPLNRLEQRQEAAEVASRALGGIRSSVESIRLAAAKISESTAFSRFSATSSSSTVTATSSGDAAAGSLSFRVTQLATNHAMHSSTLWASPDSTVTASDEFSQLSGDFASTGVSAARLTSGTPAGDYAVTVTQSSSVATKRGDSPLGASTDYNTGPLGLGGPSTINLSVNGAAVTVELAGTLTPAQVAQEFNDAFTAAGADAEASIDADGHLVLQTIREGSDNTIQVVGGDLADLGLTADAAAIAGDDAIIDVNGTTTSLTDIVAGSTVTVATAEGGIELDLSGAGLRAGSFEFNVVDFGSGSLADVVEGFNNSDLGVTAAAVRVGENQWRLQLTSTTSGEDGEIPIDPSAFGGLIETTAARNARISIGETNPYTVESSSNTFEDVLTGTSITVSEITDPGEDPVTINVARDTASVAGEVAKLVTAMNAALTDIKVQTRYGVDGAGNGALAGDGTVRRLADQLRASLSRPVDGISGRIGADVGIEIQRDGTFKFDAATFSAALEDDPDGVARFFSRGASTPAGVTFADATADTVSGSYAVEVTVAATQATSARFFDGGVAADGRIGIMADGETVLVDVTAGQTSADVINAINAALGSRGLDLTAEADGGGLVLRSEDWGSGGDFELNLDVDGVGTYDAVTGVDVEGTIAGIAATGIGRTLSINPLVDSPAAGLSVDIDGGVTGVLGDVTYQPGLGARVTEFTTQVLGEDGSLDNAQDAQKRRIEDFNDDIDAFEDRLFIKETNLRRQWANLQTLLEGLQQRGNFLAGQFASLTSLNG